MGMRLTLGFVILAAATAFLFATQYDSDPSDESGTTRPEKSANPRATWAGIEMEIPQGWRIVDTAAGARTWASQDRSSTLTIGSVRATDAPLAAIVASTRQQLAETAPAYRSGTSSEHSLRGGRAIRHDFFTGTSPTVRVEQLIARGLVDRRDVIITATAAIRDSSPQPELMSVQRSR